MGWWDRLWRRKRAADLLVRLSEEEREVLEFWAARSCQPLEAFVRDALLRAVPSEERRKYAARQQLGDVLDASFAMLDALEEPVRLPVLEEGPDSILVPSNHSCGFLDETFLPEFGPGLAFGVCRHPAQSNRPCFWDAPIARGCRLFRAKKVKPSR